LAFKITLKHPGAAIIDSMIINAAASQASNALFTSHDNRRII